ncbi:MAG: S41 family peptidase [Candidatus Yanofskybacteria bacterium]|nr:S41 family peptidase [Candidatus Yanofskybacteria bacterium]
MNTNSRKILIISIILSLALGFSGGFWLRPESANNSLKEIKKLINLDDGKPSEVDFSLFWKVYSDLQEKYVDSSKLEPEKVLYGAIGGMVNSIGDPYTTFFEPQNSKKFQEEISGSFGGVGIEIGKRNDILTVIAPLKDTPAYKAGIKAGDKILKIDNKPTDNISIEEAVNLIRGKKGTKVILTINNGATKDVELIRDTIKVPTIEWKLVEKGGKNIAYMQIFSFNQTVDSEFRKAAEEILKSDADAIVLDLRNNPGGLLDSAINLAGWFLDKGKLVVSEEFGNGMRNEFKSDGNGALKSYPMIILINGGSASASEILAGAIHDNKGTRLVGIKSFGKGSVQELEKYDDGSSLKVTIAKWLTPDGISISETGIEPDVKVEIDAKEIEAGNIEIGTPGKDPQLDRALDLLK